MTLFLRTLSFFLSGFILQSLVIFFLVTNIVNISNQEDARGELSSEHRRVDAALVEMKQLLWESLITIKGNAQVNAYLEGGRVPLREADFRNLMADLSDRRGVDWIVIRDTSGRNEVLTRNYAAFPFEAAAGLKNRSPYPHGDFFRWNDDLYFYGTFLTPGRMEVFLVKQLSADYLRSLGGRSDSMLALFLNGEPLIQSGVPESLDAFLPPSMGAKRFLYDVEADDSSYNLAFSRIGEISPRNEALPIILGVAIDNSPYQRRLWVFRTVLLWVAAGTTLVAGFLGYLFSRHIASPAGVLLGAMDSLRRGDYKAALPHTSIEEFQELFTGFKSMAQGLERDRVEMESYINDITALKEFNETVIESLQSGIAILNSGGRLVRVNGFFLSMFALTQEVCAGERLESLLPQLFDADLQKAVEGVLDNRQDSYAVVRRLPRYRVYDIKVYHLSPVASNPGRSAVVVIDDISTRTEAEEKLYRAEKLSSISLLSAGVAHEINNPLTSMLSNVQMLIEDEEDPEKRESLHWMENETRRIARIVRKLLEFSGGGPEEAICRDARQVIENVGDLLNLSVAKDKAYSLAVNFPSLPPVAISSDELKQIAINILKNSIQALERKGHIGVAAEVDEMRRRVALRFSDDGRGMSAEELSRAFDPFFTTKSGGEGTGLGLSLVYGLVEKNGGSIDIQSTLGAGTTVTVYLPLTNEESR